MKKIITICMFAVTLCLQGQVLENEIKVREQAPDWMRIYTESYVGYMDRNGQEIVPPIYNEIGEFGELHDGFALIVKDDLNGLIDREGNVIVEPKYESIQKADDYNKDWLMVSKDGLFGFIDASGKEVVKPMYTEIQQPKSKELIQLKTSTFTVK